MTRPTTQPAKTLPERLREQMGRTMYKVDANLMRESADTIEAMLEALRGVATANDYAMHGKAMGWLEAMAAVREVLASLDGEK